MWADLPGGHQRRPALVVTRTAILRYRDRVTVAPISTKLKGISSEVKLGRKEGLRKVSAANCGELVTVPIRLLDPLPIGRLGQAKRGDLDQALRNALGIDS